MISVGAVLLLANVFLVAKGIRERNKIGVSLSLLGVTVLLMAIPIIFH